MENNEAEFFKCNILFACVQNEMCCVYLHDEFHLILMSHCKASIQCKRLLCHLLPRPMETCGFCLLCSSAFSLSNTGVHIPSPLLTESCAAIGLSLDGLGLEVITEERVLTCVCQSFCPAGSASITTPLLSPLLPVLLWTNPGL